MTASKHRVVCHRAADTVGGVVYVHNGTDGPTVEVVIDRATWEHLGRPTRVTATIRPGNHLTGDDT